MKPQPVMVRRVAAAQATLDKWQDVPFAWGKADCVRMVAGHLKVLGYKVALAKGGSYASALSATRALQRAGYANLSEALDAMGLVRIPPAAVLAGDILMLAGDPDDNAGFDALAIALGNGRVLCWHPDAEGAVVCQPSEFAAAWSVA